MKQQEKPFEIDKNKLIIAIILFLLCCYGVYLSFNIILDDAKQSASNNKKIDICIEIDNKNSTYIKHINDYLYINNKRYKYLDIKLQCELKNKSKLEKEQLRNITLFINNTLYK